MTDLRFYHLTRDRLEPVLTRLLTVTLTRGQKAQVMTASAERAAALSAHLWSFDPDSFVAHGTREDGHPEKQPIWLTDQDEHPNAAQVLFLTDGASSEHIADYETCAVLFDGNEEQALVQARAQWKTAIDQGYTPSYWQQGEKGWEEKVF